MTRTAVYSANGAQPKGAYSQAIVARGLIYSSGVSIRPERDGSIPVGVVQQTRQVLGNLSEVLSAANSSLADVVRVNVYLADPSRDFDAFNATYKEFFDAPFPARTTIGAVLGGDAVVEIDVVALEG